MFELKQILEITTEALLSVEYYWTCNKQITFTPVDVAVNPVDKDCLFYFSMRKASLIPSADYALSENVVPPISRVEVELSPEGGGRIRFGKLIHVAKWIFKLAEAKRMLGLLADLFMIFIFRCNEWNP